jgi:hypothetical protein
MPLTIAWRPDRGRSSECLRRRFHSGARSMCQVHLAHTSVSFARNSELHRRRAMMRLYSIMSNLGQDPTKHDIERVVESWFSNQKWQFDGNSAAWQFTDGHLPSFGFGPRVAIRKYSRAKSGGNSSHKTTPSASRRNSGTADGFRVLTTAEIGIQLTDHPPRSAIACGSSLHSFAHPTAYECTIFGIGNAKCLSIRVNRTHNTLLFQGSAATGRRRC